MVKLRNLGGCLPEDHSRDGVEFRMDMAQDEQIP